MAVQVHSPRGICARPALQDAQPALRARGLAAWVAPGAGREIDAEAIVRAARVRRKLGNARHAVATVRGGGYQFVPGACATVRGPAEYSI